jgi:hypothetical protein
MGSGDRSVASRCAASRLGPESGRSSSEWRAELDARCDEIDAAFRRLITVHGSSEDEVYRLLHPPTAREIARREEADRKIGDRLKVGRLALPDNKTRKRELQRLLPNPRPPRKPAQPKRDGDLRQYSITRHMLMLLRAEIWRADERRLVTIERKLSKIDVAVLRREADRHRGRVIGGTVKAGKQLRRVVHHRKRKATAVDITYLQHDVHYEWKELAVGLPQQKRKRSILSCAKAIKERGVGPDTTYSVTQIRRGLVCRKCPDPDGYQQLRRGPIFNRSRPRTTMIDGSAEKTRRRG